MFHACIFRRYNSYLSSGPVQKKLSFELLFLLLLRLPSLLHLVFFFSRPLFICIHLFSGKGT